MRWGFREGAESGDVRVGGYRDSSALLFSASVPIIERHDAEIAKQLIPHLNDPPRIFPFLHGTSCINLKAPQSSAFGEDLEIQDLILGLKHIKI